MANGGYGLGRARGDTPYPCWVAWYEAFWERDDLCLVCCGLLDQLTRLLYSALEVEPDGLDLSDGNVNF